MVRDCAGRLAGTVAVALLLCAAAVATSAPSPASADQGATQELATLTEDAAIYSSPDPGSRRLGTVSGTRPITGSQTTLPVIAHANGEDGADWLKVLLPGRPNGHSGWITGLSTIPGSTEWSITVHTSARRVSVYRDDLLEHSFKAVVGKPSTPTPHGSFFLEEIVKLGARGIGAPFALALSARSHVLRQFEGGPGQIAIHGRGNVGGVPGTAASHGCIRLRTYAITWLAHHIDSGTRIAITS